MHQDPSDLGLLIRIRITPNERTLKFTGRTCLKAMLHESIFLQLATPRWRIKNLSGCTGGVTLLQPFSQFATRTTWRKSPASERWALIGPFWQNCVASCWGDVTRKQLVSQRCEKYRVVLLFLQLATQQLQLQNGVLHAEEKFASCNLALRQLVTENLPSASGPVRVVGTYRHIGSKSTNHSPLAWRREGQKVTLVAVIGGFRSDLPITCMTEEVLETFPRVDCFPKSRINGNGGNGNSEDSSRGRSLSYLFNSCSKEREALVFWNIIDWLLRDYKIRSKRECEKLLS